jgi:uncharacterized repeat protein (TIGR01451 family)
MSTPQSFKRPFPLFARLVLFFILLASAALSYTISSTASVGRAKPDSQHKQTVSSGASTEIANKIANQGNVNLAEHLFSDREKPGPNNLFLYEALPPLPAESVSTFASNCTTPKTSFVLGETVCAVVSNAPASPAQRLAFVDPSQFIRSQTNITSDPQSVQFTIPTTATTDIGGRDVDNRGTWTVVARDAVRGTVRARATFTVTDPDQSVADLGIVVNGSDEVSTNSNATYTLDISNNGPNAAQAVTVTNASPEGTTFVSQSQSGTPTFSCTNPTVGGTGTTTCTISSLPAGARVLISLVYQVNAQSGATITDSASISSTTFDKNDKNNSSEASSTVVPQECTVTCPPGITVNNDHDQYGAIVTYTSPTASPDSCPVSCSPASGTFFPVGTTTITCNSDTGNPCGITVTVNDTQAPTITSCSSNITTTESAPGSGSALVNVPPATATDNGPTVTVEGVRDDNQPLDDPYPTGTTTITWTATDGAGNTATCQSTVTVTGTGGCALHCPNNITVDASADACSAPVNFAATANEDCDPVVYTADFGSGPVTVTSGSTFPVGTTVVTASSSSRSCTFRVTVRDAQPPTISCPSNITVDAPANTCQATVNVTAPTASDNCSGATVIGVRDDGLALNAPYPAGSTVITWTATDGAGNTSTSCSQTITVRDTSTLTASVNVPDADVDALLAKTADENCQALIPDLTSYVVASDSCGGAGGITITQSPAAGTVVGPGSHAITVAVSRGVDPNVPGSGQTITLSTLNGVEVVRDSNGNVISTTIKRTVAITFVVTDHTPPTITAPGDVTVPADAGACSTLKSNVSLGTPTTSDNCAPLTVTNNAPASFPLGDTTVTWTATDVGGNSVTATQKVTVVDTQGPVITLNGASTMTVECHTSFSDPGATANDNCAGTVAVTASGAVDVNTPGTYMINYNASDPAGNAAATVTRTVIVADTIAPVITLKNSISLWPPNHKYTTINTSDMVQSINDSCAGSINISNAVISKVTSDEAENSNGDGNTLNDIVIANNCKSVQLRSERDGGGNGRVYSVTIKVTDASGNVGTAVFKVKVPQNANGAATEGPPQYTVTSNCP